MRLFYLAAAVILFGGSWAAADAPVVPATAPAVSEVTCAPSHSFRDRLRRLLGRDDSDSCDEPGIAGRLHGHSGGAIPADNGSDKRSWWVPNLFGIAGYSTFPGTAPVNLSGNGW